MTSIRSIAVAVALCMLVSASLVGCGSEQGFHSVRFTNETRVRVTVVEILASGFEIGVVALDPGNTFDGMGYHLTTYPCSVTTFVARDQKGVEVARREGKICLDDEWVIGAHRVPPSPVVPALLVIASIAVALGLVLIRRAWLRAGTVRPPKNRP